MSALSWGNKLWKNKRFLDGILFVTKVQSFHAFSHFKRTHIFEKKKNWMLRGSRNTNIFFFQSRIWRISAKEVMFSLPFVCLFVCKITQNILNRFCSDFHRICLWWPSRDELILVLIRPGNRIREGFKIQKPINIKKLPMDFTQIFTEYAHGDPLELIKFWYWSGPGTGSGKALKSKNK